MADEVLNTTQGHPIDLDFFLGLGCKYITNEIRVTNNVTVVYESFLNQIDNVNSTLWQPSDQNGCFEGLCQNLFGGGNPDISGIGVVVAYALEVLFAVFLSSVLLYAWRRNGEPEVSRAHPKTKALVESLNVFADTSLFFALSIVFATCLLQSARWVKSNGISQYDSTQAVLSSTTTVAPCLAALYALQCCGERVGRRMSILGIACVINVGVIVIPIAVRDFKQSAQITDWGIANDQLNALANDHARGSNHTSVFNGDLFYGKCYNKISDTALIIQFGYYMGLVIGIAGQVVILGFVLLLALNVIKMRLCELFRNIRRFRNNREFYKPPQAEDTIKRTIERKDTYLPRKLEIFGFMFVPLAMSVWTGCTLLGQRLLLSRTWKGEDETKWGFGQMVALLMFLPVIIEFPYQWLTLRSSKNERRTSEKTSQFDPEEGKTSSDGKHSGTIAVQEIKPQPDDAPTYVSTTEVSGGDRSRSDEISEAGRVLTPPIPPPAPVQH